MATTFKGICKSLKYITQMFVVKEREMEIGYPTDVKHVAHVGWDGPSGNGPSWMDDFKKVPEFSTSIGNLDEIRDSDPMAVTSLWSSIENQQSSNIYKGISSAAGDPHIAEKPKQKKVKSASSSRSPSSSSRRSRASKSKATFNEREAIPIALM
ncbi:putative CRIB domain-containing protein [Medicago truncatula]|uniref:P21-Rho-binding domain protein n=1 Tax=Medicago truncatula TaxID=3880 RepID=A0A072VR81_MEDTR|nr:CRIB domain-containing protein RIC1 isoform X1 [Medicago truncatula]KEH43913.1 P21-Rho-binding domain protein [Medicago truncatula]RHN82079.1 putative CRIB domain-containing protein [Medicago truncatula]